MIASLLAFAAVAQPKLGSDGSGQNNKRSESPHTVELRELASQAEDDLKQPVLVSQEFAQNKIQTPKNMKKIDYDMLLGVLRINDYTAIRSGELIKIIPVELARNSTTPVVEANGTYHEDEYVTEYLSLDKSCAEMLIPMLRPMMPRHSHIAANTKSRSLVISDTYGNIQRLKKVIKKIEDDTQQKDECGRTGRQVILP